MTLQMTLASHFVKHGGLQDLCAGLVCILKQSALQSRPADVQADPPMPTLSPLLPHAPVQRTTVF